MSSEEMSKVKEGVMLSILELPGVLAKRLSRLEARREELEGRVGPGTVRYGGVVGRRTGGTNRGQEDLLIALSQNREDIEDCERLQDQAGRLAAKLIEIAANPLHKQYAAWFGGPSGGMKDVTRASRNGLLLWLIYVDRQDWPGIRDNMAECGWRTSVKTLKIWHRAALRDLVKLEERWTPPPEWRSAAYAALDAARTIGREGGGTE